MVDHDPAITGRALIQLAGRVSSRANVCRNNGTGSYSLNFFAAILIASLVSMSAHAQERERFVPTDEAKRVSLQMLQDGLALHLTVKNDSSLVVTGVDFACEFRDRSRAQPPRAPNGMPWCTPDNFVLAGSSVVQLAPCVHDKPITYFESEPIRPGKSHKFYYEMGRDWPTIYQCGVSSLRGREPRFWER